MTLAAGQTLQLDFTADPRLHDLDLEVFRRVDGLQVLVGESFGEENAECVRIGSDGEYWIRVFAYRGASLYNLRIAAAGERAARVRTATGAVGEQRVLPGRVIAGLADGSGRAAAASALAAAQPLALLQGRARARARRPAGAAGAGEGAATRPAGAGRAGRRGAGRAPSGVDGRTERRLPAPGRDARVRERLRASGAFDHVMPDRPLRASALVGSFPPNDPRYSLQRWHYEQDFAADGDADAAGDVAAADAAPDRRGAGHRHRREPPRSSPANGSPATTSSATPRRPATVTASTRIRTIRVDTAQPVVPRHPRRRHRSPRRPSTATASPVPRRWRS
ncbi:MAG: hypothetical protein MZW92_34830 [Comamonadaceae bacterium]|nr:hypothetical protein [Comamonadaceae bacterium]